MTVARGIAVAAVFAGLAVGTAAGCDKTPETTKPASTINPEVATKAIIDMQKEMGDGTPTQVSCPSGVEAKVDVKFDCHFNDGLTGHPATAHMRVVRVNGDDVKFDIDIPPH